MRAGTWTDGHRLRDRPGSPEGAGHRTAQHQGHGDNRRSVLGFEVLGKDGPFGAGVIMMVAMPDQRRPGQLRPVTSALHHWRALTA